MAPLKPCQNRGCCELIAAWSARKYCSDKCRLAAWRMRNKKEPKNTAPGTCANCKNCGDQFVKRHWRQVYCKVSCRVSHWQQMKRLDVA